MMNLTCKQSYFKTMHLSMHQVHRRFVMTIVYVSLGMNEMLRNAGLCLVRILG